MELIKTIELDWFILEFQQPNNLSNEDEFQQRSSIKRTFLGFSS